MTTDTGRKFLVKTFMTEEEYQARRDGPPENMGNSVYLVGFTKYGGLEFTEQDIAKICWDAAEKVGVLPADHEDEVKWSDWRQDYNYRVLPFALKQRVLDFVERTWAPDTEYTSSEWIGTKEDAEEFFEDFPELLQVFWLTPEQMGELYNKNMEEFDNG